MMRVYHISGILSVLTEFVYVKNLGNSPEFSEVQVFQEQLHIYVLNVLRERSICIRLVQMTTFHLLVNFFMYYVPVKIFIFD